MDYLVDTNIFIKVIPDCICGVVGKCREHGDTTSITETILSELEPGLDKTREDESLREPFVQVNNLVTGKMGAKWINKLDITSMPGAFEEYNKIRKRYYSWMTNATYLKKLVAEGRYTESDIKKSSFRNKDKGECELIAVALSEPGKHKIVSDDEGVVFEHPESNIFKDYAIPNGAIVIYGKTWLKEIAYKKNKESD